MTRRLWIAVERHVVSRDIIGHAADVLKRPRVHVLGHMVAMWGEVAEDAKMGNINGVRDSTIEHWAQWDGEPGAFAAFVREFCVTDGVISGWDEMQGRFERARKTDAERKAAERKRPVDIRRKSGGRPRKSTVTVHNKTVQDSNTTTTTASSDTAVDEVIAHYLTHHPTRRPGPKERKAVAKALESYSVDDLKAAIDGNASSKFHKENGHQSLLLIMREGKVDDFRLMPKPFDWDSVKLIENGSPTEWYYKWIEAGEPV